MSRRREWNLKRLIVQALRKIFFYSPMRAGALTKAKRTLGYQCAKCKKLFDKVMVDHIKPVINPSDGFEDWNTFIKNLFCGLSNLQCLCKGCHDAKTKEERKKRKVV